MAEIKIGKFFVNVLDVIGTGSFGMVFSGRNGKTGAKVAVKKIQIKKDKDGYIAIKEIKNFERLPAHPNLISLLDFHYKDNAIWMIMDFCAAGDLDRYMYENQLSLEAKLRIMFQSACAIGHMHNAKPPMIHRDIKPANILLFRESGDNVIVKMSDFGLSKLAQGTAATALFSTVAGTAGFLAPELFESQKYTLSVDVFALGLVFLAMIQQKEGEEHLTPRIDEKRPMLQIGNVMSNAAAFGNPQPDIVLIQEGDRPEMKKLKAVILKTATYEPPKRLSASEVTKALGEITGCIPVTLGATAATSLPTAPSNERPGEDLTEEPLVNRLLQEALLEKVGRPIQCSSEERERESTEKEHSGIEIEVDLVEMFKRALGGSSSSTDQTKFGVGERVRVDSDESKASRLQEGYGGWNSNMKPYLGKVGVVKMKMLHVLQVQFSDGVEWAFNPELLHSCDETDDEEEDVSQPFKRFDVVYVEKDTGRAKRLQENHGGWKQEIGAVLGLKGIVNKVDRDGDVLVECVNGTKWFFNPNLLTVVDTSHMTIEVGDFVLVIDSYKKVKALQDETHGGWNPLMGDTLGKAGVVLRVLPNGLIQVKMGILPWTYNEHALRLIAKSEEMMEAVLRSGSQELRPCHVM